MDKLLEALKKMQEERSALMVEVDGADEKRFSEIELRVKKLDYMIGQTNQEIETKRSAEDNYDEDNSRATSGESHEDEMRAKSGQKKKPSTTFSSEELRSAGFSAFGKMLRSKLQGQTFKFSDAEKRAVGEAYFTTSDTYSDPTTTADGVNNGGVFIPQNIVYDLLNIDEVDNQFLKDCHPTFERGVLVYPYVKTETYSKDKAVKEKEKAGTKSVEFDALKLTDGDYAIKAGITLELLAKADAELGQYVLNQLAVEADLILSEDVFYGSGDTDASKNTHILGVTTSISTVKSSYDDGKEIDAITDAYLTLSRRARKGAKLYISRKLAMKLTLKKDDSGRYLLPIYNGVGIQSIIEIPVVTSEDLKDFDFIMGNAANYKINFYGSSYSIYQLALTDADSRVQKWLLHMMVAGAPAPEYFVYGTLKSTTTATK